MEPFWVIDSVCPQDPLPGPGWPSLTCCNPSAVSSTEAEHLVDSRLVILL